jgi:branched-subunit amino acid transport protein
VSLEALKASEFGLFVIVVLAALVSDVWRMLGVIAASRIDDSSDLFRWVKAVATALVAALVARLVLFPTGGLAEVPLALRLGAVVAGAVAYAATRRSLAAGVLVAVATLVAGSFAGIGR